MAGLLASVAVEDVTSGTAKKTLLQLLAPTNQRIIIKSWGVFCQGTSGTAAPGKVQLLKQTTAGTMSAASEINLCDAQETIQTVAQHTATVEPTDGDILEAKMVHPQSGYEKIYPPNQEIMIPGGERVAIAVTFAAAVDCTAFIVWEE